jgi:16S rRNA (cytosine967-C5)-methyltransferase
MEIDPSVPPQETLAISPDSAPASNVLPPLGGEGPAAVQAAGRGGLQEAGGIRDEACRLLVRLEGPEARARELLDDSSRHLNLSAEDAGLLGELVYGSLRARGRLDYYLSRVSHRPLEALSPWVRNLLRLSLYQLLELDRIPVAAAVDGAVEVAKRHGHDGVVKFVNGCLRELARQKSEDKLPPLPLDPVLRLAMQTSHPAWMAERLANSYGFERAAELLQASDMAPPLTLRSNATRVKRDDLLARVQKAGLQAEACRFSPWGLTIKSPADARKLAGFFEGDFHIQDESAQLLGLLLAPEAGWAIADVCAAPGGKTSALAEWVGPTGRIFAFDRKHGSLDKLQSTLRRQGVHQVVCETRDALSPRKDLLGRLDGVLVDAPCSALGVLRRRVEARWQTRADQFASQADRQFRLLQASAQYLRPGGVMVYATCTLDEEENESVVRRFLDQQPGFVFERAQGFVPHEVCSRDGFMQVWPGLEGMDGFFAARLRRVEG